MLLLWKVRMWGVHIFCASFVKIEGVIKFSVLVLGPTGPVRCCTCLTVKRPEQLWIHFYCTSVYSSTWSSTVVSLNLSTISNRLIFCPFIQLWVGEAAHQIVLPAAGVRLCCQQPPVVLLHPSGRHHHGGHARTNHGRLQGGWRSSGLTGVRGHIFRMNLDLFFL